MTTHENVSTVTGWLTGRLPEEWTATAPEVVMDREEITVVLTVPGSEGVESRDEAEGRVSRFREETRQARMAIADEAERRYGRKVAWGATVGEHRTLFTTLAVPMMTRLRQPERMVLDTLVDSGVARSRAHALAWCVRLVGENSAGWLADLRGAMEQVEKVRATGPTT